MELLLCHLMGDYIFQTDIMARSKRDFWHWAVIHAICYTIPFLFVVGSWTAIAVICISHFCIDYWGLAIYVTRWKNQAGYGLAKTISVFDNSFYDKKHYDYNTDTGYQEDMAPWMAVWLNIITDNTLHLLCNWLAFVYL